VQTQRLWRQWQHSLHKETRALRAAITCTASFICILQWQLNPVHFTSNDFDFVAKNGNSRTSFVLKFRPFDKVECCFDKVKRCFYIVAKMATVSKHQATKLPVASTIDCCFVIGRDYKLFKQPCRCVLVLPEAFCKINSLNSLQFIIWLFHQL